MYLEELQRTPKVLESTPAVWQYIRTRNRCTLESCIATLPARVTVATSQAPKWTRTPRARQGQPTSRPTFFHSIHVAGVKVLYVQKSAKKVDLPVSAARAPNRSLLWPGQASPPPARASDSASWPEFADYLCHKIRNKVFLLHPPPSKAADMQALFWVFATDQQNKFAPETLSNVV